MKTTKLNQIDRLKLGFGLPGIATVLVFYRSGVEFIVTDSLFSTSKTNKTLMLHQQPASDEETVMRSLW